MAASLCTDWQENVHTKKIARMTNVNIHIDRYVARVNTNLVTKKRDLTPVKSRDVHIPKMKMRRILLTMEIS